MRRFVKFLVEGTFAGERAMVGGCVGFAGGLVTGVHDAQNICDLGTYTGVLTLVGAIGGVIITPIGIISGVYGLKQVIAKYCRIKYCRRDYDQCEY